MSKGLTEDEFRPLAIRSESPNYNDVPLQVIRAVFMLIIHTGIAADLLKKALFYSPEDAAGRIALIREMPIMQEWLDGQYVDPNEIYTPFRSKKGDRLLHGILGKYTEAVEMMECLGKSVVESRAMDIVNLREEIGDDQWYNALIMSALEEYNFNAERYAVIEKLKKRYPEKFEDVLAEVRNLDVERSTLEEHLK